MNLGWKSSRSSFNDQDFPSALSQLEHICEPLQDLARFWESRKIDIRVRFQRILFPVGYVVTRIGTAPKAQILSFFEGSLRENSMDVALEGQSWNQLVSEIHQLVEIFQRAS